MNKPRLPLALELTEPVLLALETDLPSEFDPKTQLSSNTRSTQNSKTFNLVGVLSDIAADVQVDDVIA
jgi:hypothetical protein